ncbi:hypothetical protein M0805_007740 [Coniferiporia weirii]|nr:hypothetical protein M0805_007740 [Coniferiporia weirii]
MAQPWGTGQPGFQYPMQTGFQGNPGQFQPGFGGGIAPQQTGFPGQRPPFQQPQQTGFQPLGGLQPQQTGFQPQQTGFQQGGGGYQQQVPPVPPLPGNFGGSGFGQANPPGGFPGGQQQQQYRAPPPPPPPQRSFLSPSPAFGGGGSALAPQVTGFPGAGPLVPQVTGYVDPRLQMMSSTFMPANPSMPYAGGVPQFANTQPGGSLQQSIQQYNQQSTTPRVAWALTKAEKKNYDQIFRAWDAQSTGFISGQMALEVFGQSGLDKNELAKIWALADADNRGKLNLAEFHVAMGLIYRRLNGVDIPDQLPPELVPPSSRDLDTSVNLLKDILRHDTSRPSSASSGGDAISRQKVRSFNDSSQAGAGGRKDATVYKYKDDGESGEYYQSRSRHIDRRNVRVGNESPSEDLESMKRQLENTAKMLDQSTEENANRTREDEELEREMEDLRYRIKRIQEDLEYVSRGPRSTAKDEERRKLERDLLHLMHERIPEVEKKQEERQRRHEREKREWQRERDRRNDRFGRYDERSYDRDRDESGYTRGTYDRDRDRDYDRDRDHGRDYDRDNGRDRDYGRERDRDYDRDRDRPYGRDRDRDRDRPRTPPAAARSPPPAPPPAPAPVAAAPPPAPKPSASPAPNMRNMSKEEREAFIREQAQRRLQERMRALGVTTPGPSAAGPASPSVDTTVEDRLARERKEAEEKAVQAEKAAEERERSRKERVESERALKEGKAVTPSPAAPVAPVTAPPAPSPAAAKPPPPPVLPQKRAPAPPPPIKRGQAPRLPVSSPAPPPPAPPAPQAVRSPPAPIPGPEVDPEEEMLREREERLRKQREARAERLRQLEQEEEEARRAEEDEMNRRRERLAAASRQSSAPSTPVVPPVQTQAPPPPPPPAPPAPAAMSPGFPSIPITTPSAGEKSSTNPFSKLMSQGQSATTTPATPSSGGTNPFFRAPQPSAVPAAPAVPALSPPLSKSPAPLAIKTSYNTAPQDDDDWGDANEVEAEDSSDDEISSSRNARDRLAQQLFGGTIPRPQSGASSGPSQPQTPAPRSAPAAPAPPPPPPAPQGSVTAPVSPMAPPPPPAPAAPMAPPAPAAPVAAAPGDRGALLSSIAAGARLRKTVTNDRSSAPVAGQVIGDTAPPPHINAAPRPASPTLPAPIIDTAPTHTDQETDVRANYRQSVDWYAGLAADHSTQPTLSTTIEENEEEEPTRLAVPDIHVQEAPTEESPDPLEDVDKSKEYRVRTLYPYEGQRPDDLSFSENVVVNARPSKSGGAWWYGTIVKDGKSGFFPSTYVQELENVKAKALYSYSGGNSDELPFVEGDVLTIVDRNEADWWKTEQGGVIFIVPAAYLEVIEGASGPRSRDDKEADSESMNEASSANFDLQQFHSDSDLSMRMPIELHDVSDDEGSSDGEEYHSFESSESESESGDSGKRAAHAEEDRGEHEARELERQRVLEAAGLLVKKDDADDLPPPRPARRRSVRRRRTPPETPNRVSIASTSSDRDLSSRPTSVLHIDDAFERYETYRHSKNYRLSMSSYDTGPPSPGLPPSLSATPSKEGAEARPHTHSNIFNFLTRTKTPVHEPDRPRLQISAPILGTDGNTDSPSRAGSPAFGSSWASLLERDALEGIPSLERKRQETIFELINTEATYVRDLQLIVEVFYSSMVSMLDEKEITVVFANIEDLLLVNTAFLSSLEERQKECRLYIDSIGDLLVRHMDNMGVYANYCVNQGNAIKILQSIRESRPEVAAHLQKLREDPAVRSLDLSSYLLAPMQRITRYPLLLRQILNYTEVESDRKQISSAHDFVERILKYINEAIREQEGRARLEAVSKNLYVGQGRLDLAKSTSYMGQRKLLKEGPLMKYKSGRKLRVFLCNDMLILTDDRVSRLYKMPIQLNQVDVKVLPGKDELGFQLVFAYPRGGEAMAFKASSLQDCKMWMKSISVACRRARDVERRAVRDSMLSRR